MDIEKPEVEFFRFFWYFCPTLINPKTLYKLRRTWYKMAKKAQIKSAHLQPDHQFFESHILLSPNTYDNSDTSESEIDIPFLPDTSISSFNSNGIG